YCLLEMRYIDAEGKVEVWSGSIQPHDIWLIKGGFRFEVCFNRYYQPIRKGGAVLVKFVADIAKKDELCPIGVVNWRNVNKQVQADIVELIRVSLYSSTGKFLIPDGKTYNDAMLKHVEVEDEVFNELMYDKDNSNQKPVVYGFGVRPSDVMGVHALLRKKGIASEMNNDNNDLKVKFARHKKETANLIMRLSSSVSDLLTAVQSGRVSQETLATTNSALRTAQVSHQYTL
ncbi:Pantothenate synthetase, partial [Bienertia sinuspersici]